MGLVSTLRAEHQGAFKSLRLLSAVLPLPWPSHLAWGLSFLSEEKVHVGDSLFLPPERQGFSPPPPQRQGFSLPPQDRDSLPPPRQGFSSPPPSKGFSPPPPKTGILSSPPPPRQGFSLP
ncbi:uncharacterized protein LOC143294625, partial [Babylonia areolata]|uniref:uncharacterized protein LOC143294625 n=1 Tax=Babylonia areolata TaxID=304850 RepID=UPI003FD4BB82